MEKYLKISILLIIISVFSFSNLFAFAASTETGASLKVTGCNINGTCEPYWGEDSTNCPLDCSAIPPGGGENPIFNPPEIYNLLISKITVNSAEISWETKEQALCSLFLGETQEYEKEVVAEEIFYLRHEILLNNLSSGTKYYFKISCKDFSNQEAETKDQEFITLVPPDTTPPANVSNFQAIAGDEKIELKWTNPTDSDFKLVKIMRSTDFYPSDPFTGAPVYSGKGEGFFDVGLTNGIRYYYTIFAYDMAGNYSSGAIVSAVPNKPGIIPPPEIITPASSTPEVEKLIIDDFDFIQDGVKIIPIEGKLKLKTGVPLTAAIPYEKVPEVLKTIMITLNKNEEKFSFLLRINKEKNRYEATILAPDPGVYPLTLSILDYKNQSLKTIKGQLIAEGTVDTERTGVFVPWYMQIKFWILLGLLILLLIAYFIWKKIKKDQEPKSLSISTNDLET